MKLWVWKLESKVSMSGGWNGVSKKPEEAVPHSEDVKYWLETGLFYRRSPYSKLAMHEWLSKRREE